MAAAHASRFGSTQELYFRAAHDAVHVYRRAHLFRRFAVVFTLSIWLARTLGSLLFNDLSDAAIRPVLGISLLVAFFTYCLEWSTRWQCRELLERYDNLCDREEQVE